MLTKFVSIGSYSPEVRTFGTLITFTKVFSLIIICNSLCQNDPLPRNCRLHTQSQSHSSIVSWVTVKAGLWTLDWTVDWTVDWILDRILDRTLDIALYSRWVVFV